MLTLKICYPDRTDFLPAFGITIDGSGIEVHRQENDISGYVAFDTFVIAYIMNEAAKTVEVINGLFNGHESPEIDNPNN